MPKSPLAIALLFLAPFLSSCSRDAVATVRRSSSHMGTVVTITASAQSQAQAERAIQHGFAEVARLDRLLSSYRSDSDLSRLNAQAGAGPVEVSPELLEVTQAAVEIAMRTGGAFNPLLGPAIELWGIPQNPRVPAPGELHALRALTDLSGLKIIAERGTISLARPGMALSLGGIGKGYAADKVAAVLRREGVTAALIEVGGDVLAFGGRTWRVAVRDPSGGTEPLTVLALKEGAMSTSGDYERFFEVDGVRYHHILDPKTLQPARGVVAVTTLARKATEADALATAVLVMGVTSGMELVERTPGLEALVVDAHGGIHRSMGWPSEE